MNGVLLALIPLLPIALALSLRQAHHRWLPVVAALAAALCLAILPSGTGLRVPWLLLGVHLVLDETAGLFLAFSLAAWLLAALYRALGSADGVTGTRRFTLFFLLAMGGNLLAVLAADMLSFYLGFALMGLAAYGLLPGDSQRARRAARVYLGFTLAGELLLFAAIAVIHVETGALLFRDVASVPLPALVLLLLAFGIKVALPGLHPWLPMTYATGPVLAVAVLSGPIMKVGLLGWLRFLPPGGVPETAGHVLLLLGTLGVVLGVSLGLLQQSPRALLGYSSVAKMGLMTAIVGAALAVPGSAPLLLPALALLAMHHLLVKSLLFLGVAEWLRRGANPGLLLGMLVLVLTMVGIPFSGGAAAKEGLAAGGGPDLSWLLSASALGTTLLMARLLQLLARRRPVPGAVRDGAGLAWFAALPVAFWAPFPPGDIVPAAGSLAWILGALLLFAALHRLLPGTVRGDAARPGDVLACLFAARRRHVHASRHAVVPSRRGPVGLSTAGAGPLVLPGIGLLLLALALTLALLLPPG